MSIASIFKEIAATTNLSEDQTTATEVQYTRSTRLWGRDHASQAFHARINCVARCKQPVLIWKNGDADSTEVAEWIHRRSPFARLSFVQVSCQDNPFETWEKALTQFIAPDKLGMDSQFFCPTSTLRGGTLFLDDLEFLPKELRCGLLALLNEEGIIRLTGSSTQGIEVRVVASSTSNIWRKSLEGAFLSSLLSQLNRTTVYCPPHSTHSQHV